MAQRIKKICQTAIKGANRLLIFVLLVLLWIPGAVTADTTPAFSTLLLSSHEPSTAANYTYTVELELPAGEALIFSMPGGFDLSSLTTDDIDVSDDGVDLTLADDCSGTEEAGISIGATTVFIDICSGDGGDIAAGSSVVVEIGNHALSEATGVNQIVNPSTEITHLIQISTTNGISSTVALPIVPVTDGAASATVPSSGGGGGGGGGTANPDNELVEVRYPYGSSRFVFGDVPTVEWATVNVIGTVDLYYSIDNGVEWTLIAEGEEDDGEYDWAVPNSSTEEALIRVDAVEGGSVEATDNSNAFEIVAVPVDPEVTITSLVPSSITVPDDYTLEWIAEGDFDSYDVLIEQVSPEVEQLLTTGLSLNEYTASFDTDWAAGDYRFIVRGYVGGLLVDEALSATFEIINEVTPVPEPDPEPDPEPVPEPDPEDPDDGEDPEPFDPDDLDDVPDGPVDGVPSGDGGSDGGGPSGGGGGGSTQEDFVSEIVFIGPNGVQLGELRNNLQGLPGTVVDVSAFFDGEFIRSARVLVNDQEILMNEGVDGSFSARMIVPDMRSPVSIVAEKGGGGQELLSFLIEPKSYGAVVDESGRAIAGAVVTVFKLDGASQSQWSGEGQSNPVITGESGAIGWYAVDGNYLVRASRNGYETNDVVVAVRDGVLNPTVELIRKDEIPLEAGVIDGGDPAAEDGGKEDGSSSNPVAQVREVVAKAVSSAVEVLDNIREIPEVEVSAKISQPVVATTAAVSTVALATSFNFLPYLQYIFSAPFAWFARRKKRSFGIVFDSDTLTPVGLAGVRLLTSAGKVVSSTITDTEGRFFLRVSPGEYQIQVSKKGYQASKELTRQVPYQDVYSGGMITVTGESVSIAPSVAVQKTEGHQAATNTPVRIRRRRILRVFLQLFGLSGAVLSVVVFAILQTPFALLMVFVQIGSYAFVRLLASKKSHKGWGIVQDAVSKTPLKNAVVRLFDPEYNKLLETTVTDGRGRYAILAGPRTYYATVERGGYQPEKVDPVDFSRNKQPALLSVDVSLQQSGK